MGFNIWNIAVPIAEKEAALAAIGVVEADQADEDCQSPCSGAVGPKGHYIIWKNGRHGDVSPSELGALKKLTEALILNVYEGIMCGELIQLRDGAEVWRIAYEGIEGTPVFMPSGNVPREVLDLYEDLLSKQAAEDGKGGMSADHTFEILSMSFQKATSFKYDISSGTEFYVLEPEPIKPWWKFWQ
ncbi:hypothetical protein [uncultured Algimonas sp.]|uniref:hypothetical protein n=1 Tax=uncultured Algimonas sp. TaxID=1547920 RepID=UPI002616E6E8|nr:hypothetical protein [uncultured Algimonas sp.]